jgi:Protein of unknown function (DUF3237)
LKLGRHTRRLQCDSNWLTPDAVAAGKVRAMTSEIGALPEVLTRIRVRHLFQLHEAVPPLYVIGPTPNGFRRIGVVAGGAFEGERLSGEVVTGNDWQDVRSDDCTKLDVRLLLKTMDGALIAMTYHCLRAGSAEILAKLDRGEAIDPATYYFRFTALFETSAAEYGWLNRIVAVGIGERLADGPHYNVFEIL